MKKMDPGNVHENKAGSQQAGSSGNADCSAQILINQEILSQLHKISQRLIVPNVKRRLILQKKNKNKGYKSHTSSPKVKQSKHSSTREQQSLINSKLVGYSNNKGGGGGGADVFVKNQV